eukprot:COSAG02_NODE_6404_length_3596_cov_8.406348_3_plen_158_part_00
MCGARSWKLDTASAALKWSQLPPRQGADTHPVGDTKGYALWRGRYILSIGVIGRSHTLTYPNWQFNPIANDSLLRSARLNDTCSPPLKGWGSNSYPNGIAVYGKARSTCHLLIERRQASASTFTVSFLSPSKMHALWQTHRQIASAQSASAARPSQR